MRWLCCVNLGDEAANHVVDGIAGWAARTSTVVDLLYIDEGAAVPAWVTDPVAAQLLSRQLDAARNTHQGQLEALRERLPEASRGKIEAIQGSAVEIILQRADGYDLVALAGRRRAAVERALLGSVAAKVARRCPTPVMILPSTGVTSPSGRPRALVGVDIRDEHTTWLKRAAEWSRQLDLVVDAVHVDNGALHVQYVLDHEVRERLEAEWEALRARDLELLGEAMSAFPPSNRGLPRVEDGDPAEGIVNLADDYEVLVVATHGRTGLQRWWLGSIAEKVMQACPKPVLLLRLGST